ncbi:MAG: hypothetical protein Q7R54_03725 [bacterium]|nr:hypothetical protein [bacterium]
MNSENIQDLNIASTTLIDGYENQWVALSRDHTSVVASAPTLVELDRKIVDHNAVVYTRVLPKDVVFAPACVCG